ncbi:TPA: SHOCT domain-containing protein [Candidatus Poribacteria bacterium]|nr:SHOCT domain-containing protein [Candidatus Poribacteria bacterium]
MFGLGPTELLILVIIAGIGVLIWRLRKKPRFFLEGGRKTGSTVTSTRRIDKIEPKAMLTIGIIVCVIGGVLGVWVITRFTSFAGQLHSWSPPFSEYEVVTLVGLGAAAIFVIVGLILLMLGFTRKSESHLTNSFRQQTGASTPEQTRRQESVDDTASIPKQIEQLAKLKEQGILSDEEFEEKKHELLSRM